MFIFGACVWVRVLGSDFRVSGVPDSVLVFGLQVWVQGSHLGSGFGVKSPEAWG